MQKVKNLPEPQLNTIENANANDKGRFLHENSLDVVFFDPPLLRNSTDKQLNNWKTEQDYLEWCRIFINIVSAKLKKTGILYLIGDIEDVRQIINIILDFEFQLSMTYYFTKNKKSSQIKKSKDGTRTVKVIESVFVFTRNFQKKVKKILKLKQQEKNLTSREINIELNGNGNGGGYWSLYCGDNSKNILPTEQHWQVLKELFDLDLEYNDINTQFRPFDGINLWEEFNYEEDKLYSGINRPVAFYERLIEMNRKEPSELLIWDPFCGYGNSIVACKKLNCSYFACEFDIKVYYKALINTGENVNFIKPVVVPS